MSETRIVADARSVALTCALIAVVALAPVMPAFAACDVGKAQSKISFKKSIEPALNDSCALSTCHIQPDEAQDLVLQTGKSYLWLIDVPSFEVRMKRVAPGDPKASYLVHKLLGTHHEVGGDGERMPFNLDPLTAEQIAEIVAWINDCSPNN